MQTVRKLFYVSRATASCDDSSIRQMLRMSRRNNLRLDITGCLLYSGRHFGQVLEGGSAMVASMVLKIASDRRHTGIRILSDRLGGERDYAQWSMRYLHDLDFEDSLSALLADGKPASGAVDGVMQRMRPDPVTAAM